MWVLGISAVIWDPGVDTYIFSSWLPNVVLAAFTEAIQKTLIE